MSIVVANIRDWCITCSRYTFWHMSESVQVCQVCGKTYYMHRD